MIKLMKNLKLLLCLLCACTVGGVNSVKAADPTSDEYDAAMTAITDGGLYRITTTVNRTTYYLTTTGTLTDSRANGGLFTFTKGAAGDGKLYDYAWDLGCKFTNPDGEGWEYTTFKNVGYIRSHNENRDLWERQVFFKNAAGKYAVRATNASGTVWGANTYWCVANETVPEAGYDYDPAYIWELKQVDYSSSETKTPVLLLKGGEINTTDFTVTPIAPSTSDKDNLYAATFTTTSDQKNAFQYKNWDVSAYDKVVIKYSITDNSNWGINLPQGGYPPSLPTGEGETSEIDLRNYTSYGDFTVFTWSNGGTITISEVYLSKYEFEINDTKPVLEFNEYGKATIDKTYLTATGGLSYNAETGVLTSDGNGGAGTLTLEFDYPVDLNDLYTFEVKRSGNDNIVNRVKFYDSEDGEINTWSYSKWANSGLDYNATNAFRTHNPVKKMVWELDAANNSSSMTLTITGIEWQKKTISAIKGTDITTLPYKLWDTDGDNDATVVGDATPAKNFYTYTDVIYGNQNIGDSKKYVDLTNYKKLIIRGYGIIRLFYNWSQDPENKPIDATSFVNNTTTVETMELDIPTFMTNNHCSHFHLIGVKGSGNCFVEYISVLGNTVKYDYTISGNGGLVLASAEEALNDATASTIDASGLTVSDPRLKETLTTANPNCLIVANANQLDNENNVIVDNTCANLVLTDGYPFKAPSDFTASAATYNTTISTAAGAGTLCLPFAATIPSDVYAWTLEHTGGDVATATLVETTIPANTPVLLNKNDGGSATFSGANAAIDADATNVSGALTGVFQSTNVLKDNNNYVLQKGTDGLGFYEVTTDNIVVKPFRAYLTATAGARSIRIEYSDATGVNDVNAMTDISESAFYNLSGQRVAKATKGLYIKNGKKVIVK